MFKICIKSLEKFNSLILKLSEFQWVADFSYFAMTAITAAKSGSESNKTKKEKNAAPTRVVIRRLPPSMTRDDFEVQVSPIPEHDNLR